MESVPAFARFGRTAEKSFRIQIGDEGAVKAENGDREDGECIQAETAASSLEPYMILAKLRFDIVLSRQK